MARPGWVFGRLRELRQPPGQGGQRRLEIKLPDRALHRLQGGPQRLVQGPEMLRHKTARRRIIAQQQAVQGLHQRARLLIRGLGIYTSIRVFWPG